MVHASIERQLFFSSGGMCKSCWWGLFVWLGDMQQGKSSLSLLLSTFPPPQFIKVRIYCVESRGKVSIDEQEEWPIDNHR